MKVGEAVKVVVPEKGSGVGGVGKYPFDKLVADGTGIPLYLEPADMAEGTELVDLKKKVKNAAMGYEKKQGKTAAGEKVKEVAVWVDEEEGAVMIALREDRSQEPVAKKVAAKKPAAKKAAAKE